jgi:hypothetical protein
MATSDRESLSLTSLNGLALGAKSLAAFVDVGSKLHFPCVGAVGDRYPTSLPESP